MTLLTFTEENYLQAIYALQTNNASGEVSVNEIAERMKTKPATVTDMMKKLSAKDLVVYERYKKLILSESGKLVALQIVRKHRLWETFLHQMLHFSWDEVHEVAEELEHIHSQKLIDGLDKLLKYPQYDPHGDPIPNEKGILPNASTMMLSNVVVGSACILVGVKDTSSAFLKQLKKLNLDLGNEIKVLEEMPFDHSIVVLVDNENQLMLSEKIAANLLVRIN